MILGYVKNGLQVNRDHDGSHYVLEFSQEEFDKAVLEGETIKHLTFCREMSGVWEVKFKKNSAKKHKKLIGG